MKFLLLYLIKVYWQVKPKRTTAKCLFRESCSKYVYRNTLEKGLVSGLKSLLFRFQHCRSGYYVIELNGIIGIISKKNHFFSLDDLRDDLTK